jgi:2-hydroxychromene-2-carboxylate isomerase
MIAQKIGRTLKIQAYSPNGHASIFLTSMKVDQPNVRFAVASVLGINAQGVFSSSEPASSLQKAKKWAVAFTKKKLGDKFKFKTAVLR